MNSPSKTAAPRSDANYTRTRKRKTRFGANETVSAAVAKRTRRRARALGFPVGTHTGPVTGHEARAVLRARRKQKESRGNKLISGSTPRSAS
jgi:hypothetical protein